MLSSWQIFSNISEFVTRSCHMRPTFDIVASCSRVPRVCFATEYIFCIILFHDFFYLFNISDFHSQFLHSKAGFHILPPQANISHNSFLFWRECPEQVLLWNISTFYFSTKVQNLLWPWIFLFSPFLLYNQFPLSLSDEA